MIVVAGVQVINAGVDLLLGVGNVGVEAKQALVADQTGIVELVGDIVHGVGLVNRDGDGLVFPPEGQNVGGADPDHPTQGDSDDYDQRQPHHGDQNVGDAQQTLSAGFLGASLFHGTLTAGRFAFRGRGVFHGVKIAVAVPVFLFRDLVLRRFRFRRFLRQFLQIRIVQNAGVEGRLLLAVFQHSVGIHGAVVGDDPAADLRLREAAVIGLFRAVVHVGDAIHKGTAFFGGVIGCGDFFRGGRNVLKNGDFFRNGSILICGNVFLGGSILHDGFVNLHWDFLGLRRGFLRNHFFGEGDIPGVLRFLVGGKEGQLFGNDFLLVPFGKLFVVHIVFLQGQRMTICSATACAAA